VEKAITMRRPGFRFVDGYDGQSFPFALILKIYSPCGFTPPTSLVNLVPTQYLIGSSVACSAWR